MEKQQVAYFLIILLGLQFNIISSCSFGGTFTSKFHSCNTKAFRVAYCFLNFMITKFTTVYHPYALKSNVKAFIIINLDSRVTLNRNLAVTILEAKIMYDAAFID